MSDAFAVRKDFRRFSIVYHDISAELDPYQLAIYVALIRFADNEHKTAYPTIKTLASAAGMSERKASSTINDLVELGLVRVIRRWKNSSGEISLSRSDEFSQNTSNIFEVADYLQKSRGVVHEVQGGGASGASGVVHEVQGGGASGAVKLIPNITNTHLELDNPLNPPEGDNLDQPHRLPERWIPSEEMKKKISQEFSARDGATELVKFREYWSKATGKRAEKKDWDRAFLNWCRKALKPGAGGGSREQRSQRMRFMIDQIVSEAEDGQP